MTITIKIFKKEDQLNFLVSNNGQFLETKRGKGSGGTGLSNLRERLNILYPDSHSFGIWDDLDAREVLVKTSIPLRYDS